MPCEQKSSAVYHSSRLSVSSAEGPPLVSIDLARDLPTSGRFGPLVLYNTSLPSPNALRVGYPSSMPSEPRREKSSSTSLAIISSIVHGTTCFTQWCNLVLYHRGLLTASAVVEARGIVIRPAEAARRIWRRLLPFGRPRDGLVIFVGRERKVNNRRWPLRTRRCARQRRSFPGLARQRRVEARNGPVGRVEAAAAENVDLGYLEIVVKVVFGLLRRLLLCRRHLGRPFAIRLDDHLVY